MSELTLQASTSAFMFVFFGILMYRLNKLWFTYLFIFYFPQLWATLSSVYIETGIYLSEQGRYSYATGATSRLVLYNMIFFLCLLIFIGFFKKSYDKLDNITMKSNTIVLLLLSGITLTILLLLLNLVKTGIPLLSDGSINRFNFWKQYAAYPKMEILYNYINSYAFLLGLIFSKNYSKFCRKWSLILFVFLFSLYYLHGNAFGGLFSITVFFLLPNAVHKIKEGKGLVNKKWILIISSLLVLFVLFKYIEYRFMFNYENPLELVIYRIFGLQGHVWWGTDVLTKDLGVFDQPLFKAEDIFFPSSENLTGMQFLMVLLGGNKGYAYIEQGINFTMGYPAIIVLSFGYLGAIIFQIGFTLVLSLLITYLDKYINSGALLRAMFIFIIFSKTQTFASMGSLSAIFNMSNLLCIIIILLIEVFSRLWSLLKKRRYSVLINRTFISC